MAEMKILKIEDLTPQGTNYKQSDFQWAFDIVEQELPKAEIKSAFFDNHKGFGIEWMYNNQKCGFALMVGEEMQYSQETLKLAIQSWKEVIDARG